MLILLCTQGYSQIFTDDFSTQKYTVTQGGEGISSDEDYFIRTDGTNIDIDYNDSFYGLFFAAQDIDGGSWTGESSPSQLTWENIDILNYSDLKLSGKYAASSNSLIDKSDYLILEYNIDNNGWQKILAFENDGTTYNTNFQEDTNFDGNGNGILLTPEAQYFEKDITGTGSIIQIRITVAVTAGKEDIAFDDLIITGTANVAIPTLSVTETLLDNFVYEEGNGPSNSQSFNIEGQNISDDVTISPFTNYELSIDNATFQSTPITISPINGTLSESTIYVRLKTGLTFGDYNNEIISCSSQDASDKTITCNGSITLPQPSDHVSSYSGTSISSSAIHITWVDDDGLVSSDKQLILLSTNNTFELPINDEAPIEDLDFNDGTGIRITDRGTQEYIWNNLNPNTRYYFQIIPYQTVMTSYAYKTNETIPEFNTITCSLNESPIALNAITLLSNSFTATWHKDYNAEYYLLDVYKKNTDDVTQLINQSFNDGSTNFPENWEKSTKVYTYSNGNPGKAIKLGASATPGFIITSEVDCSANSGIFSVQIDAIQYNETENKISILHASDGINFTDQHDIDLSENWESYTANFTNGNSLSKIKVSTFSTTKERAYIDNLIILQGEFIIEYHTGYENKQITDTIEYIDNLYENTDYFYRLKSFHTCGSLNTSAYSNTIKTRTPEFLSEENEITAFSVPNISGNSIIDNTNHTINLNVFYGTDISSLNTQITVSEFSMVSPTNNSNLNYSSSPVKFDVTAQNGDLQPWLVSLLMDENTDATLSNIFVDNLAIDDFNSSTTNYSIILPYGSIIEDTYITGTLSDANAEITIEQATDLKGSESERTASIKVSAEDTSSTKTYFILFSILAPNTDASLTSILINSDTLKAFNPDTLCYGILLDPNTSEVPNIEYLVKGLGSTVILTQAQNLTGTIGERTTIITATAQNGINQKIYKISYRLISQNAQLSNISIDNIAINNFNPTTSIYYDTLIYGTTIIPDVSFETEDSLAITHLKPASNILGSTLERTTNIEVTAEDNESIMIYSVIFNVALNSESHITSNQYSINDDLLVISNVPYDHNIALFLSNINIPSDATYEIFENDTITSTANLATGNILVVSAQNGINKMFYQIILDPKPLPKNLIISQYYEGLSNNKWIEVYNADSIAINLKDYSLCRWTNTFNPSGVANSTYNFPDSILNPNSTILIRKSTSILPDYAIAELTSSVNGFNGDDAIALTYNGNVWENRLDCIYNNNSGKWGENKSFVRKEFINKGNMNPSTFDPLSEWLKYSYEQIDTAEYDQNNYLGFHNYKADTIGPIPLFSKNSGDTTNSIFPTIQIQFDEKIYLSDNHNEITDLDDVTSIFECYEKEKPSNLAPFKAYANDQSIQIEFLNKLKYNTSYLLKLKQKIIEDNYFNKSVLTDILFTTPKEIISSVSIANAIPKYFILDEDINLTWDVNNIDSLNVLLFNPNLNAWITLADSIPSLNNNSVIYLPQNLTYSENYKLKIQAFSDNTIDAETSNFEIIPTATNISDIYSKQNKVMYRGEAIISYSQNYRGQKYMQDNFHGIMIDDVEGIITSNHEIGDQINNTIFAINHENEYCYLNPLSNPDKPYIHNQNIDPIPLNIGTINSSPENYQSRLVNLNNVKFISNQTIFEEEKAYVITDGLDTMEFYTLFYETDYNNKEIPDFSGNISGLLTYKNNNWHLSSRSKEDLDFEAQNKNTRLSNIIIGGQAIDSFAYDKIEYFHLIEANDSIIPIIEATSEDVFATIEIEQAEEIPGYASVLVSAQDTNFSQTYSIWISKKDFNSDATLKAITINDSNYFAFDSSLFSYSIILPYETLEIPLIKGIPSDSNATINYMLSEEILPSIMQIEITAQNGFSKQNYFLHLQASTQSNVASLSNILFDEIALLNFHPDSLEYNYELKKGLPFPEIKPLLTDNSTQLELIIPDTLPGDIIINLIAADSITKRTYIIHMIPIPLNTNVSLSEVIIDNQSFDLFDPNIYFYRISLEKTYIGSPIIKAIAEDSVHASINIELTNEIPGTTYIHVSAEDTNYHQTYEIFFDYKQNSNALLEEITIDGNLLENFVDTVFNYEIYVPYGSTQIPNIDASLQDTLADMLLTNIPRMPDTVFIIVTAEDKLVSNNYSVCIKYQALEEFKVSILVNNDNSPLEGASVFFNNETINTDTNGIAEFNHVLPVIDAPIFVNKNDFEEYYGLISVVDQDVYIEVNIISVSIKEDSKEWSIYPNPTRSHIYYECSEFWHGKQAAIYSIEGKLIKKVTISKHTNKISLININKGIYFITFTNGLNHKRQRFVVE